MVCINNISFGKCTFLFEVDDFLMDTIYNAVFDHTNIIIIAVITTKKIFCFILDFNDENTDTPQNFQLC